MDTKRWQLLISGRVQGVYYRASTEQKASALGLTGFARNLPDGRVEVVAEGQEDQLTQLKTWCADGPPNARVDSVDIILETATGEFSGFGIR
ncbi:acylphosphatase [Marinobacter subterrani]|uniref:acylphosphatase n=1 Tax=Marinobacter subterrani TaxID=1658765 RepID=A0A0J7J8N3_9GAMM|nr:acylphosphatase [Marinobacter subterrani]KMQ74266.1 Acylphosphatase [Marinobacter subterrani]